MSVSWGLMVGRDALVGVGGPLNATECMVSKRKGFGRDTPVLGNT